MKILNNINQVVNWQKNAKKLHQKIALVPTMGSLHEGHFALIQEAKKHAELVVVTIFVNKAQFNDIKDFEKYPRNIESDIKNLEKLDIDALFLPNDSEIFPSESNFDIIPKDIANILCGKSRKGHFAGACLIVSKFFNIIQPDFAVFGKKDFQQYFIIKKMVQDLNFNIEIIGVETVRENSGLALSSRNARLNVEDFAKAEFIHKILNEIKNEVKTVENIDQLLQNKINKILNAGFEKIDYLEIRSEDDLKLAHKIENEKKYRIFLAVYLNGVRLIDNLKI